MERRQFLRGAAVAAAGTATLAAPAIAQEKTTWRMVTTWPKNFPGLGVGAQRLADRITAMSDGRLTIQVYSAGEIVPALGAFDAVIEGSAEMSHGAAYYWQNKSPATPFFTGVPYGMNSRELASWIRYMGGQELYEEVYDQFGLIAFINGDTGTQAGGWFQKELTGLDDIKGLKFRTPGLGGKVWEMLGASVVNMGAGDIFAALQSGSLDAAEFVGPYNDLALGFYQVCKHYYLSSFIEPGLATELAIDKAKYTALPADLQAIVQDRLPGGVRSSRLRLLCERSQGAGNARQGPRRHHPPVPGRDFPGWCRSGDDDPRGAGGVGRSADQEGDRELSLVPGGAQDPHREH